MFAFLWLNVHEHCENMRVHLSSVITSCSMLHGPLVTSNVYNSHVFITAKKAIVHY